MYSSTRSSLQKQAQGKGCCCGHIYKEIYFSRELEAGYICILFYIFMVAGNNKLQEGFELYSGDF